MKPVDVELRSVTKVFGDKKSATVHQALAVDNVSLQIYDGEFFALLGPSGCGKTTTLRMVAGFEDVSSGEILIRGNPVHGIPPFHRPVNTVFQDYALFPHMTVLQNVMFGLRMQDVSSREARQEALKALELVQLPQVADRKPRQLSGGQQQRIALARALVKKPAVLLLDEPLGALDLKLRKAMQFELKAMQQQLGMTFIYVTHDQEEAMTMADRIAVMSLGKVLQIGNPQEIYEQPNSRFVADFIGETNFVPGTLQSQQGQVGKVKLASGDVVDAVIGHENITSGNEVTLAIRPEKIGVFPVDGMMQRGEGQPISVTEFKDLLRQEGDNTVLTGRILQTFYIGTDTRYIVQLGENIELVARVQNFSHRFDTLYKVGDPIHVYWDNDNARVLSH